MLSLTDTTCPAKRESYTEETQRFTEKNITFNSFHGYNKTQKLFH